MKVKQSVLDDLWSLRDEYMFLHEGDDSLYGFLNYLAISDADLRKDIEELTEIN